MHRSWRSYFLLSAVPALFWAAGLAAQSADELPAAPSEVNRPKPAPPKPAATQEESKPAAETTQAAPTPAAGTQGSTVPASSPEANPENEPVEGSGGTIRAMVNEVNVVFT